MLITRCTANLMQTVCK